MQEPSQLGALIRQDKMFEVFKEHHRWQSLLGIKTVGDFNEAVGNGEATNLINVSEALQEKKISQIADKIAAKKDIKVVLIAGPSSSGKTTFCKRLSVQLLASGVKPVQISLDDYFVNREETPKDEQGEYDYEGIYALNIPLINEQFNALFNGQEVELPKYNFQTGSSEKSGNKLRLEENNVLVVEESMPLTQHSRLRFPMTRSLRSMLLRLLPSYWIITTISQQLTIDYSDALFVIISIVVVLHKKRSADGLVCVLVRTNGYSLIRSKPTSCLIQLFSSNLKS